MEGPMIKDDTLDYILSPAEAAADPDQAPASGKQRLRIHIPNVRTTLTMGAKAEAGALRGEDLGPINSDGFGVHTKEGHVYCRSWSATAALASGVSLASKAFAKKKIPTPMTIPAEVPTRPAVPADRST